MKIIVLAAIVTLVGCSKTDEEIAFERQKELLLIQQKHQQEMARIDVERMDEITDRLEVESGNKTVYTPVIFDSSDSYDNESSYSSHSVTASNQGYSGSTVALSTVAGVAAGYAAKGASNDAQKKPTSVKVKEAVSKVKTAATKVKAKVKSSISNRRRK